MCAHIICVYQLTRSAAIFGLRNWLKRNGVKDTQSTAPLSRSLCADKPCLLFNSAGKRLNWRRPKMAMFNARTGYIVQKNSIVKTNAATNTRLISRFGQMAKFFVICGKKWNAVRDTRRKCARSKWKMCSSIGMTSMSCLRPDRRSALCGCRAQRFFPFPNSAEIRNRIRKKTVSLCFM